MADNNVNITKNYNRLDKYGNPLVQDWLFMHLVEKGRDELDKQAKFSPNIFEDDLAKLILIRVENEANDDYLDPNCDMTYQDFREIVGTILNKDIAYDDFQDIKILNKEKYTGYIPNELITNDFKADIKSEYYEYKAEMIKNFNKEGIFDNAYEINFYKNMTDYFQSLTKDDVESIKEYKKYDFSLSYLYDRFLKDEYATTDNYENIKDFLERCVDSSISYKKDKNIER